MTFEISEHTFNSNWYGAKFGISSDSRLLEVSDETVREACSEFAVVELRIPSSTKPKYWTNKASSFKDVDFTIDYRLGTKKFADVDNGTEFVNSEELPINIEDFSEFSSERYLHLPNMTSEKLSDRYQSWAVNLMRDYPRTCGTILSNDLPQGYVFGSVQGDRAHFALGVTSRQSNMFGLAFYQKAIQMFNKNGAKSVFSSFSASNLNSLNLHAALGCKFLSSTTIYFWVNSASVE